MIEGKASVRRGRGHGLVLRPTEGSSVRRLSAALRVAGVAHVGEPGTGVVSVSTDLLDDALGALRTWSLQIDAELAEVAGRSAQREAAHERALEACRRLVASPEEARAALAGYEGLDVLDPHQVVAVAAGSHPDITGLCVFDEQGLGKTVEALFSFDRSRELGLVGKALVFAPKNMLLEWVRDLERFFPGRYRAVAVVGSDAAKRALLDGKSDLYVTNFETAATLGAQLRDVLGSRGLLIVDESFFVKNEASARTAAVKRIRSAAARCLVLCGTPAPNSAVDLIEQFNIADGGIAFGHALAPPDPEEARTFVADTITRRGVYLRRLKVQVLPLPGRTFNRVHVQLEHRQRALYDDALSSLASDVATIDEEEFKKRRGSFMARRMTLLQVCSNPVAVDPDYHAVPAKLVALDQLLAQLVDEAGEKVLIWSFFTASLDMIAARYDRYSPVRIDGKVPLASDRREAVRRFQEDDRTMLFLGNPAAAGAGLTLHRARHAVYESMSNQAAHYLQSLDRIHRRGQERPVEYHVLLAAETIETIEYERLLRKESAAQDLLGDVVEAPVTREGFLSELLGSSTVAVA